MELKEKDELNLQESTATRTKILKRFVSTDTALTKTQNQAIEVILVDYHDIFAGHRTDIGMNAKIKPKLTLKDDKFVYNQICQCQSF